MGEARSTLYAHGFKEVAGTDVIGFLATTECEALRLHLGLPRAR